MSVQDNSWRHSRGFLCVAASSNQALQRTRRKRRSDERKRYLTVADGETYPEK